MSRESGPSAMRQSRAPASRADDGQPFHCAVTEGAETVFRARVQALDILAMPVDNEGARHQRSQENRQLRMLHDPDGQRKSGRGADGAERNVARPRHHDHEDDQ